MTSKNLVMACLRNFRVQFSFAIFRQVHSNLKEVSYLPWQNKYSNLKTTFQIKPKFFLWAILLLNLLLWEISHICCCCFKDFFNKRNSIRKKLRIWSHLLKKSLYSYSHLSKVDLICFNRRPLKMMKNSFYVMLKALFVLKIFKFLLRLFWSCSQTAW